MCRGCNYQNCMKIYLVVLNIILLVLGGIILITGILALISFLITYDEEFGLTLSSFAIFIGFVTILTSLLCLFAIKRRNFCLLWSYAAIFTFTFILGFVLSIPAFIRCIEKLNKEDFIKSEFNEFSRIYKEFQLYRLIMDSIQQKNKCCGMYGPGDYPKIEVPKFPESCCEGENIKSCEKPFTEGCGEYLYTSYKVNMFLNAILIIFITGIQLFAIVSACILANSYKANIPNPNPMPPARQ